jgi:Pentapeptide repeats (8 copies)
VPDADNSRESGQTDDGPRSSRRLGRHAWLSSLWLWPAVAIASTGLAGTLFGTTGALLVGGEAVATLALAATVLVVSRNRGLVIGVAALVGVGAVFAGLAWAPALHRSANRPAAIAAGRGHSAQALDWRWRIITQGMASRADFRGADLENANLDGLELTHKNFDGASANGASFRGSQLEDASLRGASLQGACLVGANLTGADLTGANFSGAEVAGVTVLPDAEKAAVNWPSSQSSTTSACQ